MDLERRESDDVEMHRLPAGFDVNYEDYWYPIQKFQVSNLLGQVLTQLDAMNLSPDATKANRNIFIQMMWRWFDEVMDNSVTSADDRITPIKIVTNKSVQLSSRKN